VTLGLPEPGKPPGNDKLGKEGGHRCTGQARGALISLVCPALNVKLINESTELINIPQIGF
jgi:hypothetical protein